MTDKFKSLIHYICWKSYPKLLDITGLCKISHNVDMNSFKLTGKTVTAEKYIKGEHGPIPERIYSVIESLKDENKVVYTSIYSMRYQLEQIKQSMGFNISELAKILVVTRQTIYTWMGESNIKLKKKHQARLSIISEAYSVFIQKQMVRLGSLLHKPIGTKKLSLFDLLTNKKLDIVAIRDHLENISQIQLTKRLEAEKEKQELEKYGFEPVAKEDMDDRLNDAVLLG